MSKSLEHLQAELAYLEGDSAALGFTFVSRGSTVSRGHRTVLRAGTPVNVRTTDGRWVGATLEVDQGVNQISGNVFVATSPMRVSMTYVRLPAGTRISMAEVAR